MTIGTYATGQARLPLYVATNANIGNYATSKR